MTDRLDGHDAGGARFAEEVEPTRVSGRRAAKPDLLTKAMVTVAVLGLALLVGLAASAALIVKRSQGPASYLERDIGSFEAVIAQSPQDSNAWGDYAAALIEARQYSDALDVIERGRATLDHDDGRLSFEEARLAYGRGEHDEAIIKCREAIARGEAFRELQAAALEEKGVAGPEAFVEVRAISEAFILIGRINADRGEHTLAVEAFTSALGESPGAADVLTMRADVYVAQGDTASAEADYRAALRYIPTYEPALQGLRALGVDGE